MVINNDYITFLNLSKKAAEAENSALYETAAVLWEKARNAANTKKNIEWADARYLFCLHRKKGVTITITSKNH